MDKNTIWAIVLSGLVLAGFMFFQPLFYPAVEPQTVATQPVADSSIPTQTNSLITTLEDNSLPVNTATQPNTSFENTEEIGLLEEEPVLLEQEYFISTERVNITLTNRGGDIIGYELKDHRDGEKGVNLVKNVTNTNRAFSIALGSAADSIINDLFSVNIIDDYTIGFSKRIEVANSFGGTDSFMLRKLYTFNPEEYIFKLDIRIDGEGNMNSLSFGNAAYTLRSSPQMGPYYDPKLDRYENRTFIFFTEDKFKDEKISDGQIKVYDKGFTWAGISGKYFTQQIIPVIPTTIREASYSTLGRVDEFQDAQLMLERRPINQKSIQDTYYVYMGPKVDEAMVIYNNAGDNKWGLSGFRLDESLSSGWLAWLETILKWIMEMFYKLIPNWGVSIILMTVLLKILMYPLTKKSSMSTLKMQEFQPKIKELQAKYKGSPEKLNAEMAKFYKEVGYNPLSGCLPLLIQFPLILAMYGLFSNYFEFRGAMFIPGWIPDLSVSDKVGFFPDAIPLIGGMAISLLPVIYVASQLLFTKVTQATASAAGGSSMKVMLYAMPMVFFFMFYTAPAGLLLYWTVSNLLQLVQQVTINKIMHRKREELGIAGKETVKKVLPPSAKKRK